MASCRSCEHYDINDTDSWGEGYCSYYNKHVDSRSSACSHYDNDNDRRYDRRRDDDRRNDDEKESDSGGCFLTTIACKILGEPDDGPTLSTLRCFRENVLRKDEDYAPILEEYAVLGPRISSCLWNDPNRTSVAVSLMAKHLGAILEAVRSRRNESAIRLYRDMVGRIRKSYGL